MDCHKTKYGTKQAADQDIKLIGKKSTRNKVPIRSYFCKCGFWHLTSQEDIFKKENIEMENKRIIDLTEEVRKLTEENAMLKNADNKEARHQAKINDKVKQLNDQLSKNGKTINMLRKTNSELITRIVQLEKLIPQNQT